MLVVTIKKRHSVPPMQAEQKFVVENEEEFAQKAIGLTGWRRIRTAVVVTTDLDVDVEFEEGGAL